MTAVAILLTAIVAALVLAVEHLVFRLWVHRPVHLTVRYIAGTLGLALPQSVLLALYADWFALAALWSVLAGGGVAVLGLYLVGSWWEATHLAAETAEREQFLERRTFDGS